MKESTTYQAIVEEGRAEGIAQGVAQGAVAEARKLLRIVGDGQFGPPDARTAGAIEQIDDLARLEGLCERLRTASGWLDLLGTPAAGQRRRRRPPSP